VNSRDDALPSLSLRGVFDEAIQSVNGHADKAWITTAKTPTQSLASRDDENNTTSLSRQSLCSKGRVWGSVENRSHNKTN
jgi:hypothetical protein